MVDVYQDGKTNGANFGIVFKGEMIKKRYSKHIDHTNRQEHEPAEWAQSQYNGIKVNSTVQSYYYYLPRARRKFWKE